MGLSSVFLKTCLYKTHMIQVLSFPQEKATVSVGRGQEHVLRNHNSSDIEGVFILILHFISSVLNLSALRNPHLNEQQSAAQWLLALLHSVSLQVTSVPKRLIQDIPQPSLASLLMVVKDLKMAAR